MSYVDGFVVPVPKRKVQAYKRMSRKAGKIWREYGAVDYVECIADDVKPGKVTSFPQAVKLKKGETVIFAFAVYKSRKHRDKVMAKVMVDPRLAECERDSRVLRTAAETFLDYRTMAAHEAELRAELARAPEIVVNVPGLEDDVHDVTGLARVGERLFSTP